MDIDKIKIIFSAIVSGIAGLFGGWTLGLTCVLWCMFIDFSMGVINATVFKTSLKTDSGRLSSNEIFKGLLKKCVLLSFIILGYQIDRAFSFTYVKDALCIAVTIGELTSIIENAKLMGVKVPEVLSDLVDVLSSKQNEIK